MRSIRGSAVLALLCSVGAISSAQQQGFQDELLDRKIGSWVMTGTIGGEEITHDLEIEWVLAHQYLRIHEISRELDSVGKPRYESYVHIGWDSELDRYACMWLDITGTSGFRPVGLAVRKGDSLPFVFDAEGWGGGGFFHTTFIYKEKTDTWQWTMDAEKEGKFSSFARVRLHRK